MLGHLTHLWVMMLYIIPCSQVRTLYACVGEHETELSFEPNAIITSGKPTIPIGVSIFRRVLPKCLRLDIQEF